MTPSSLASARSGPVARLAAALAYDGPVAATLVRVFQFFLVSVCFVAAITPAILFTALVGWQPTHLALWLGAASLLTVTPALSGVIAASQRVLLSNQETGAGREFWKAFAASCRHLGWLACAVSLIALVLAYDLAMAGASEIVLLLVIAAASGTTMLMVGAICVSVSTGTTEPRRLLAATLPAILRKPHIALAWLTLILVGAFATTLPIVGSSAWLFSPAAVGAAIVVCNAALGFNTSSKKSLS